MSQNKYKNVKERGFDSKKEEARYYELLDLEKQGLISDLKRQVEFELIPKQKLKHNVITSTGRLKKFELPVTYKADFTYIKNGEYVVEDVKSAYTAGLAEYIIKRKLMLLKGYQIKEVIR